MELQLRHFWQGRRFSRAILAAVTAGGVLFAPAVFAAGGGGLPSRIGVLETKSDALGSAVDGLRQQLAPFTAGGSSAATPAPIVVAQSSRDIGALTVRVGQLEEQMRSLTGQIEGLQFQMAQLQTLIQAMQEDTDARFAALEGGARPGKTDAAPQSGGVVPPAVVPQTNLTPPGDNGGAIDLNAPDAGASSIGIDPTSADTDSDGFALGGPAQPLGTLTLDELGDGLSQPMDGDQTSGALVTDADADAQYRAGYDAVVRGDYAFAEEQFRQFIALFPDHPQAPDATSWLGEALIQRGAYDDAADILVSGFQKYPNSPRSPDILLKLGIALFGAGERETACRTYAEVQRRFADQPAAFIQRLNDEMSKAQC